MWKTSRPRVVIAAEICLARPSRREPKPPVLANANTCSRATPAGSTGSRRAAASADPSPTAASKLEGAAAEAYMATLAEDLTHLFDDRGIDRSLYEPTVRFEDPLTKYDDIEGYLFNIAMLRRVFDPANMKSVLAASSPKTEEILRSDKSYPFLSKGCVLSRLART